MDDKNESLELQFPYQNNRYPWFIDASNVQILILFRFFEIINSFNLSKTVTNVNLVYMFAKKN